MSKQNVLSVRELTRSIKTILEGRYPFLSVVGEIANLRRPGSGHIYFTLKDETCQIKAVLFKMQQRYLEKQPRNGQLVVCRGRISVYEPRGDYQLIVDGLDFHGAGALQIAFEQLKKKLAAEGLFERDLKQLIPPHPQHITLVTSPNGAAVHDFIQIAQKRFPQIGISIYPVAVQGEGAAAEISQAILDINELNRTDIIVITRGGGSIEDLQAFNDEQLARTIHDSSLPLVSAVGHEIDFTIADFVADLRAPTPSGAAEILLPDRDALAELAGTYKQRLIAGIQARIDRYDNRLKLYKRQLSTASHPVETMLLRLDQLAGNLHHGIRDILACKQADLTAQTSYLQQNIPTQKIENHTMHITDLKLRLEKSATNTLASRQQELAKNSGLLHAVSPLSTLARGYAVAKRKTGRKSILTRNTQVKTGDAIEVILHQGALDCEVTAVTPAAKKTSST